MISGCEAGVKSVSTAPWAATRIPASQLTACCHARWSAKSRAAQIAPHGASFALSLSVHHQFKPRILCIDDEPSVGELLRSLLEETGDFLVEVETKAITAIARARMFKPDLVLMDINMPGQDGFALAREIRLEPWLRHRPIIFFSGVAIGKAILSEGTVVKNWWKQRYDFPQLLKAVDQNCSN